MAYSIGEFARLSGITATTLRAWQRRYGLLKPERTDGGHRLYSDEDVQQALKILDWVKKGVPIGQVKSLLERPMLSPLAAVSFLGRYLPYPQTDWNALCRAALITGKPCNRPCCKSCRRGKLNPCVR